MIFHLNDFFPTVGHDSSNICGINCILVCIEIREYVIRVLFAVVHVRPIKLAKITHSNYCIPTCRNFLEETRISIGKTLYYHNKGRSLEIDVLDGVGPNVVVIRRNDVSDVKMKI